MASTEKKVAALAVVAGLLLAAPEVLELIVALAGVAL